MTGSFSYTDLSGLMTMMSGDEKHGPSATSTLDVIWTLYDRVLSIDPKLILSCRRRGTRRESRRIDNFLDHSLFPGRRMVYKGNRRKS